MEDNTAKIIDLEGIENQNTVDEEASDSGNGGSVLAGIVGGFIAYVVIDGGKKLWQFFTSKRAEKKQSKEVTIIVDGEDNETSEDHQ